MRLAIVVVALLWLVVGPRAQATEAVGVAAPEMSAGENPICVVLESTARANDLPIDFLVRLIWQESRFQPNAVGPLTHTGARALGIAQFMPSTAMERGLSEPFNPMKALPKSGEFLAQLRDDFGNLGLAAAAYNAGPQRLRDFIAGARELPMETRNYVWAITGRSVDDWAKLRKAPAITLDRPDEPTRASSCHDLISRPDKSSADKSPAYQSQADKVRRTSVAMQSEQRKVPAWCRYVHRPDMNICGPIHQGPVSAKLLVAKSRSQVSF